MVSLQFIVETGEKKKKEVVGIFACGRDFSVVLYTNFDMPLKTLV